MKFCSVCGGPVTLRIPEGDNRSRFCCTQCGAIHYQNPNMVVGTIPVWEDRVLLCKRAIEPRLGYWTLPAGFLENGETTAEGAIRETAEEAGARIRIGPLFTMFDVLHVHQVHTFYRAELLDPDFEPGSESLEARLFAEDEIPWQEIAFRTVFLTLEHFFRDRARGHFGLYTGAITLPPKAPAIADAAASSP